jgi:hypothetical protein
MIIYHKGGDGAGGYDINWIIDLVSMRVTRIIRAFDVPEKQENTWYPLTDIKPPSIIETKEPIDSNE